MNDEGKVAALGGEKDIFLTINGTLFSRLAIFCKPLGRAIKPSVLSCDGLGIGLLRKDILGEKYGAA